MAQELVIFDCDGVLLDSEILDQRALVEVLAACGIRMTAEESFRYTGVSSADEILDVEARYQIKLSPEFPAMKQQRLRALFDAHLQPTGGIFELINHLAIKKCVASSSSLGRLEHSLGLAGLWTYFAPHVFSAMQVKHPKPAPDLFLFAAQQMGVVPAECLVIEDSIAGVKAAKAAGMRVFGYIGGSHCNNEHGTTLMREGAEQVFAHMDQLAEVLPRSTQQGAVRGS